MGFTCPECKRPVYSRRLKRCGYCGALLPEEMLLTQEQIHALDQEEARFEARMEARKKKRKSRKGSSSAVWGGGLADGFIDFDCGE